MKKKRTFTVHRALEVLKYIPLVIWVVFFVFAFGWILLASFSTTREIFSGTLLDSGVHLENYTNVWKDNNVGRYFINSILCSALSCAFIILISAPAAYVLSKKTFIGKKLTFNIFVVGMSIPQVMLIIPLYCWFVRGACGASDHIDYFIHHPECALYGILPDRLLFKRPFRAGGGCQDRRLFPDGRALADHGSHGFAWNYYRNNF